MLRFLVRSVACAGLVAALAAAIPAFDGASADGPSLPWPCEVPANLGAPDFLVLAEWAGPASPWQATDAGTLPGANASARFGLKASLLQGQGGRGKSVVHHWVSAQWHLVSAGGNVVSLSTAEAEVLPGNPLLEPVTTPGQSFVSVDLNTELAPSSVIPSGDYSVFITACYTQVVESANGGQQRVVKDILQGGAGIVAITPALASGPAVRFTAPDPGVVMTSALVEVRGEVTAASAVEAFLNGARLELPTPQGGAFLRELELPEGTSTLRLLARDDQGREARAERRVSVDSRPPVLQSLTPAEGAVLATEAVAVSGTFFDARATTVTIGGIPAAVDGRSFSAPLTLPEGGHAVEVVLTDAGGLVTRETLQVAVDLTPPGLSITSPAPGSVLTTDTVTLVGTVEDAHPLDVEAAGVTAPVTSGHFILAAVPLVPGSNVVTVTAHDEAGHAASAEIEVVRDNGAPRIVLDAPAEGARFGATPVLFTGRIDDDQPGATLRIQGVQTPVGADGRFQASLDLGDGAQAVVLEAADQGGRTARLTRNVQLDLLPPQISAVSPGEGTVLTSGAVSSASRVQDASAVTVTVNGEEAGAQGDLYRANLTLTEGAHILVWRATDAWGRTAERSAAVTVDLTAPRVVAVEPVEDAVVPASTSIRVHFSEAMASADPAAAFSVHADGIAQPGTARFDDAQTLVWTAVAPFPDGAAVAFTIAPLPDRAGRTTAAWQGAFRIADSSPPLPPGVSGCREFASGAVLQLEISGEPFARVSVTGGGEPVSADLDGAGRCRIAVPLPSDGTFDLRVTQRDAAGWVSSPALCTVRRDTQAPVVASIDWDDVAGAVILFSEAMAETVPPGAVGATGAGGAIPVTATWISPLALRVSGLPASGAVHLSLSAALTDVAGNALVPWTGSHAPALGDVLAFGHVEDDRAGGPLEGVLVAGITGTAMAETDGEGNFLLGLGADDLWVRYSKAGYLSVDRSVMPLQGGAHIPGARLMPLQPAQPGPGSAGGNLVADGGRIQWRVPAGTLGAGDVSVTALTAQSLPGLPPPGWGVLGAVHVAAPVASPTAPSLFIFDVTAEPAVPFASILALAHYDTPSHRWVTQDVLAAADAQTSFTVSAEGQGSFALFIADAGMFAPPAPVAGEPLAPAAAPAPSVATLGGAVQFTPDAIFPSDLSLAALTLTADPVLPSGQLLSLDLVEMIESLTGTAGSAGERTLEAVVERGGASPMLRVRVAPHGARKAAPILSGHVDAAVRLFTPRSVNTVGSSGGDVTENGASLSIPAGAIASGNVPVSLAEVAESSLPPIPAGFRFVAGVRVFLGGARLAAGASLHVDASEPAGEAWILALVQEGNWLFAGEVLREADGSLVTAPAAAQPVPAGLVRQGGVHVFLRADGPLAWLTGRLLYKGAPAPRGALSTSAHGVSAAAWADGQYGLPRFPGAADLAGRSTLLGITAHASFGTAAAGSVSVLDLDLFSAGPAVLAISPAAGSVGVARAIHPTVLFSRQMDPASVDAATVVLRCGAGRVTAGVSLAGDGRTATVTPDAPLSSDTLYVLEVSASVRDAEGRALGTAVSAGFRTEDRTPPGPPDATRFHARYFPAAAPDGPGSLLLWGDPGAVEPLATVNAVNRSRDPYTVRAANAGSDGAVGTAPAGDDLPVSGFTVTYRPGDDVELWLLDGNGNRRDIALPRIEGAGGSVLVLNGAAVLTTPGGLALEIPAGTFETPTFVTFRDAAVGDATHIPFPDDEIPVHAFEVHFDGARPAGRLGISWPVPEAQRDVLPDGRFVTFAQDKVFFGRSGHLILDYAQVVDGVVRSSLYLPEPPEDVTTSAATRSGRGKAVSGMPDETTGDAQSGGCVQGVGAGGMVTLAAQDRAISFADVVMSADRYLIYFDERGNYYDPGTTGCARVLIPPAQPVDLKVADTHTGVVVQTLPLTGAEEGQRISFVLGDEEESRGVDLLQPDFARFMIVPAVPGTQDFGMLHLQVDVPEEDGEGGSIGHADAELTGDGGAVRAGSVIRLAAATPRVTHHDDPSLDTGRIWDAVTRAGEDGRFKVTLTGISAWEDLRIEISEPVVPVGVSELVLRFDDAVNPGHQPAEIPCGTPLDPPPNGGVPSDANEGVEFAAWSEAVELVDLAGPAETIPVRARRVHGSAGAVQVRLTQALEPGHAYVIKLDGAEILDCASQPVAAWSRAIRDLAFVVADDTVDDIAQGATYSLANMGAFVFAAGKDPGGEYLTRIYDLRTPNATRELRPLKFTDPTGGVVGRGNLPVRGLSTVLNEPRLLLLAGDGVSGNGFLKVMDADRIEERPALDSEGPADPCHPSLVHPGQETITITEALGGPTYSGDPGVLARYPVGMPQLVRGVGDGNGNGTAWVATNGAGVQAVAFHGMNPRDEAGNPVPLICSQAPAGEARLGLSHQLLSSVLFGQVTDITLYERPHPSGSGSQFLPIILSRNVGLFALDPAATEAATPFFADPIPRIAANPLPAPVVRAEVADDPSWHRRVLDQHGADPGGVRRRFSWGGLALVHDYEYKAGQPKLDLVLSGQKAASPYAEAGIRIHAFQSGSGGTLTMRPVGRIPLGPDDLITSILVAPTKNVLYVTTAREILVIEARNLVHDPEDPFSFDPDESGLVDGDNHDGVDDRILSRTEWIGGPNESPLLMEQAGTLFIPGRTGLGRLAVPYRPMMIAEARVEGGKVKSVKQVAKVTAVQPPLAGNPGKDYRVVLWLSGKIGPTVQVRVSSMDGEYDPGALDAAFAGVQVGSGAGHVPMNERIVTLERMSAKPGDPAYNLFVSDKPLRFWRVARQMVEGAKGLTGLDGTDADASGQHAYHLLSGPRIVVELFEKPLIETVADPEDPAGTTWADVLGVRALREMRGVVEGEPAYFSPDPDAAPTLNPATAGVLPFGDATLKDGAFVLPAADIAVPGRLVDFALVRTYHSQSLSAGILGPAWRLNVEESIATLDNGDVWYTDGAGRSHRFEACLKDGRITRYLPKDGLFVKAYRRDRQGTFVIQEAGGFMHVFSPDGKLRNWEDANGNRITFFYDIQGRLRRALDTMNRQVMFRYKVIHLPCNTRTPVDKRTHSVFLTASPSACDPERLEAVTFGFQNEYEVTYEYDDEGLLETVSVPGRGNEDGTTPGAWTYSYESGQDGPMAPARHRLALIRTPPVQAGPIEIANKYDDTDRITKQTASGYSVSLDFENPEIVKIDQAGQLLTTVTLEDGRSKRIEKTRTGTPGGETRASNMEYRNGLLVSLQNEKGTSFGALQEWNYPVAVSCTDEPGKEANWFGNVPEQQKASFRDDDGSLKTLATVFTVSPGTGLLELIVSPDARRTLRKFTNYVLDREDRVVDPVHFDPLRWRSGTEQALDYPVEQPRSRVNEATDGNGRPTKVVESGVRTTNSEFGEIPENPLNPQPSASQGGYLARQWVGSAAGGGYPIVVDGEELPPQNEYEYDTMGRVTRESIWDSTLVRREFDAAGRLKREVYGKGENGAEVTYGYDGLDRVVWTEHTAAGSENGVVRTEYTYAGIYGPVEEVTKNGASVLTSVGREWLLPGVVLSETEKADAARDTVTEYTYLDPDLAPTGISRASEGRSLVSSARRNADHRVSEVTDERGVTTQFSRYTQNGIPRTERTLNLHGPGGAETDLEIVREVDESGRLDRETYKDRGTSVIHSKRWLYSAHGETAYLVTERADGQPVHWERTEYSVLGEPTLLGRSGALIGEPSVPVDVQDLGTDRWYYEGSGRVRCHVAPDGLRTNIGYKQEGPVAWVLRELPGGGIFYELVTDLDEYLRPVSFRQDGVERRIHLSYDAWGNLLSENRPGHDITYSVDAFGRQFGVTEAGVTIARAYSGRGDLLSEDRNGQLTAWTRDGFGRVENLERPDGSHVAYAYDDVLDLLRSSTDSRGVRTDFTDYDAAGRNTGVSIHLDGSTAAADTVAYEFDGLGRVLTAENNGFRIQNTYEADGGTQQEVVTDKVHAAWGYRIRAGRVGATRPAQVRIATSQTDLDFAPHATFDTQWRASGFAEQVTVTGGAATAAYAMTPWADVDMLQSMSFPSGVTSRWSEPDAMGRPTHLDLGVGGLRGAASQTAAFGLNDQLVSQTFAYTGQTQRLGYDARGRWSDADGERTSGGAYVESALDVHGNPGMVAAPEWCGQRKPAVYDEASYRITSAGGQPVVHDGRGNVTDLLDRHFDYDAANRLTVIQGADPEHRELLRYDALGRLLVREEQSQAGGAWTTTGGHLRAWLGGDELAVYALPVATNRAPDSSDLVKIIHRAPGGAPLGFDTRDTPGDGWRRVELLPDIVGNTAAALDGDGTPLEWYSYTATGVPGVERCTEPVSWARLVQVSDRELRMYATGALEEGPAPDDAGVGGSPAGGGGPPQVLDASEANLAAASTRNAADGLYVVYLARPLAPGEVISVTVPAERDACLRAVTGSLSGTYAALPEYGVLAENTPVVQAVSVEVDRGSLVVHYNERIREPGSVVFRDSRGSVQARVTVANDMIRIKPVDGVIGHEVAVQITGAVAEDGRASGTAVAAFDYSPCCYDGSASASVHVWQRGIERKPFSEINPYLFAGMEYLPAAGIYLAEGGAYEPHLGRWLTETGTSPGNPYEYAGSNPLGGPFGGVVGFESLYGEGAALAAAFSPELGREGVFAEQAPMSGEDVAHGVLNALGMIPGYGALVDIPHAFWYGLEGRTLAADLTMLAAVPVLGDLAQGTRGGAKVFSLAKRKGVSLSVEGTLSEGGRSLSETAGRASELRETVAFLKERGIDSVATRRAIIEAGYSGRIATEAQATSRRFDRLFLDPIRRGQRFSGRFGNLETRVATIRIAQELELEGWRLRFEHRVGDRYVDIFAVRPDSPAGRAIQIIKQTRGGLANPREFVPLLEIQRTLGIPVETRISGWAR